MLYFWRKPVKDWRSPDGTPWRVEVTLPGTSSALILFHHPDPQLDRYATWQADDRAARAVTARLDARQVLAALDDGTLRRLFVRSAPRSEPRALPA